MLKKTLTAISIIVIAVFLLQFTHNRLWNSGGIINDHLNGDSVIFIAAAYSVFHHHTPYIDPINTEHPGSLYCYPPLLATFLAPISELPDWAINLLWYSLLTLCFLGSFIFLHKTAKLYSLAPPANLTIPFYTLMFALMFEPVQNNYIYAQSNALVLFCITGFTYWYSANRKIKAASALAVGSTLKMFPLVFLPLLIWRREWKLLIFFALAAILLCLTSFIFNPHDGFYPDYLKALLSRSSSDYSFTEFFSTLSRSVLWLFPTLEDKLVTYACVAVIFLSISVLDLHSKKCTTPKRNDRTLWLLLILTNGIMMIHPHTELHIMVYCLPSFTLCALWVMHYGKPKHIILYTLSYLLYVPLLSAQKTPITFLSLLVNSILCVSIIYSSQAGRFVASKVNKLRMQITGD